MRNSLLTAKSRPVASAAIILLQFTNGHANEPVNPIHPFEPEMTFREMIKATPELGWGQHSYTYNNETYDEHGAKATNTFPMIGRNWTVGVGDMFNGSTTNVTNVDLKTEFEPKNKESCKQKFAELIKSLEPIYGSFGTHPEFKDASSSLYGDPYSGFEIKKVTEASRGRTLAIGKKSYRTYTFREPASDEFHRILASVYY